MRRRAHWLPSIPRAAKMKKWKSTISRKKISKRWPERPRLCHLPHQLFPDRRAEQPFHRALINGKAGRGCKAGAFLSGKKQSRRSSFPKPRLLFCCLSLCFFPSATGLPLLPQETNQIEGEKQNPGNSLCIGNHHISPDGNAQVRDENSRSQAAMPAILEYSTSPQPSRNPRKAMAKP